jgi:hypothetical protein
MNLRTHATGGLFRCPPFTAPGSRLPAPRGFSVSERREPMPPTHLTPGNPSGHLPKPPGKVAQIQQLATAKKGPPGTPALATTCHSLDPGGEGVHRTFVPFRCCSCRLHLPPTGYRLPPLCALCSAPAPSTLVTCSQPQSNQEPARRGGEERGAQYLRPFHGDEVMTLFVTCYP